MLPNYPLAYFETANNYPTWLVALVFFGFLGGGLAFYFYKTRHARLWRKGIYPQKLKLTEDNLLEAYLSLGSLLILLDYHNSKDKTRFINEYFNKYFRNATYNFGDSLLFSIRHPMQIESVCSWLNSRLKTEGERAQVIYFLTGLGMLDGQLSRRELQFLEIMNRQLELPTSNLERIISIFKNYHASKAKSEKESKVSSRSSGMSQAKRFAQILHLEASPTMEGLKQSYRKLVKQHHPDRFSQASEAQQLLAKEKFQQIQEAYEYWKDQLQD
ncbi:MAG: DnaJ domain-containing protein [bacterium]|nr:DnaJ domain-containing protein [bacterium]